MRTFEIGLIAVNLIALFLQWWQLSKLIRLWGTGVNLAVFLLHGILEGFRYQMAFSYSLVAFLVIFTAITIFRNSETKTPGVWRGIGFSISLILLAITTFLACALPVFRLPGPTGNDPVGIQYLHLVDENRADPFLDPDSGRKRELMVKVYYPAVDDRSKPVSPYFHSPLLIKVFAGFYHLPDFAFTHLNLVKTNSKEGLPISDAQPDYPVILFSHGAGSTLEVHATQFEDLASHGYVVVAIDHPYVPRPPSFQIVLPYTKMQQRILTFPNRLNRSRRSWQTMRPLS